MEQAGNYVTSGGPHKRVDHQLIEFSISNEMSIFER
jgi:hypothetical protein